MIGNEIVKNCNNFENICNAMIKYCNGIKNIGKNFTKICNDYVKICNTCVKSCNGVGRIALAGAFFRMNCQRFLYAVRGWED